MFLDKIEEQHEDIKKILRELREDVYSDEEIPPNALWIALRLGHLNALLQVHLKFEDEYLYPCLLNSNSEDARNKADNLVKTMGKLAEQFEDYINKYILEPDSIRKKNTEFSADTNNILDSIFKRIEAEEKELYSILKKNPSCNMPTGT